MKIRGKIIKGPKNKKGTNRKFIEVPCLYYDDFDFGEIVELKKAEE